MTGRLRDIYATHPMVMEAAAEIERLNRYTERLRANAERDANEIERLTAGLRDALAMVEAFASGPGMSHSGRAEFNRLAALVKP